MVDRTFLWELSQIRRHELLELAKEVRPRRGVVAAGFKHLVKVARLGIRATARVCSWTLLSASADPPPAIPSRQPPSSRPCC